jgi:hypothetical protein
VTQPQLGVVGTGLIEKRFRKPLVSVVIRTASEVVEAVLPQIKHSRARHALELLLGVEVLGVVEKVLLVLYKVVVGAPVAGTHHKRLAGSSRDFTPNFEISLQKVSPVCVATTSDDALGLLKSSAKSTNLAAVAYGFAFVRRYF